MTSTLSPSDTGDIRLGEGTRDLTYLTQRPALRRPEVTGELPIFQPTGTITIDGETIPIAEMATLVGVAELARLAASETMVLPVSAPPLDSLPEAVRRPAPTTHRAAPESEPVALAAVMPQPEGRPKRYRGRRRAAVPPWLSAVLSFAGGLVGGVTVLVVAVFLAGGPR